MSETLLSKFIKGTFSTGVGNIFSLVLNLFGTMIAARHLSEDSFGAFVLVQVVALFVAQISSFGLNATIAKYITSTEDVDHRRELFNSAILFRIASIVIFCIFVLVFRKALAALFDSSLILELTVFVLPLFALESLKGLLLSALQGFFRFRRIGLTFLIDSFFNLFFLVGFIFMLDAGVFGLIYARIISLSLAVSFAYISAPISKRIEINISSLKKMLRFGFPLQINDILTFIFRRIDTLIIGALLGPADIAYYEIARKIPDSLAKLIEAFRSVFFPFISQLHSRGDRSRMTMLINNSTRFVSFAGASASLVVLLFGNEIISLLFTEKYLPSVPVFAVLMVTLCISASSNLIGTSLVAVGQSNKPAIINTVHSGVSLLANLILIPILGIIGAAFSNLAGNSVSNPLNVIFLRRSGVSINVWSYLKPILALGVCLMPILLLNPSTIMQKLLFMILFAVACGLLSVVTSEDLSTLRSEIRPLIARLAKQPHSKDPIV